MTYQEIYDPTDEFQFNLDWSIVAKRYSAADIQSLINKPGVGVRGMVKIVNEEFILRPEFGNNVLRCVKDDERKLVVAF